MNVFAVQITKQLLPLAVAITAVSATVYLVAQQDIRMTANDPQINIAENTANRLNVTKQDQFRSPRWKTDITTSLDTFTILYNKEGNTVYSSAQLDNKDPLFPKTVFSSVNAHGEERLTWQPKNGVRIAAVVVPYTNGFVLVGRSLREIEKREDNVLLDVAFGWLAGIVATFFTILVLDILFNKKKYR